MKKFISIAVLATMTAALPTLVPVSAQAQENYRYCQDRAKRITGYYGQVPNKYLPGGAMEGAMRGAAAGAVVGVIGGKKVNTGKAAGGAALLGAIIGAAKRSNAKKEQDSRRRDYARALDDCMYGREYRRDGGYRDDGYRDDGRY